MAIPRIVPPDDAPVALQRPFPADVARLVVQAFRDPNASLDGLRDNPLLGHIMADRLLAASARPELNELREWLDRFAALPDAPTIHALLVSRTPRGVTVPPAPTLAAFILPRAGDDVDSGETLISRNPVLDRSVLDAARAGQFERAARLVERTRGLSAEYGALLHAEIARCLFSQGKDLEALAMSEAANRAARGSVGLAPWVSGLSAWRLGRFELARTWFEAAWRAPLITPAQRAAAAWWAARAGLVTRGDRGPWLRRAARDARTFYGLLARHTLGQSIRPVEPLRSDTLAEADVEAVAATPRGLRAMALLQVGQPARAAAELRLLFSETRDQPGFARSIVLVARAGGLQDLAGQLGTVLQPASVHLPATSLRPAGGFTLDPALVYALTRLESNFDAEAVSPAGARGLMQLMPVTARFVAATAQAPQLHDPATNLSLGQRYLTMLAQLTSVGPDLIRVLAAYNAGAGSFGRWTDTMAPESDPLLFIEALPNDQTRAYVPRALAYTWLYAARLGLPAPSLDALSIGEWPQLDLHPSRRDLMARLH